ncbi:MAG: hypothetical protein AAF547_24510, partial [Actinomycetota bacterium]
MATSSGSPGDAVDATTASPLVGAQATTAGSGSVAIPILQVDGATGAETYALPETEAVSVAGARSTTAQPEEAAPAPTDAPSTTSQPEETAPAEETTSTEQTESTPAPDPEPAPAPADDPAPDPAPSSGDAPALGSIKSKADDKGYDVHGHVEHSVFLLGQQVLIPGQAATGGFIQTSDNNYMAYSPITAMLPVAIQDNKEVLKKKPNLEGEKLYRRLAQEYTGSNDYKNLDRDAQRAINILTCTDWSLVKKKVRENTINHLLHSPISFGTIGSVENPISTDVTIDLGYTHTRDKNWTEVEYMGNNVYKITV